MKLTKLLLLASMMLMFALPVSAEQFKVYWDLVPGETWDYVRLYTLSVGGYYEHIGVVKGDQTEITLNLPVGSYTILARSEVANVLSADSNHLTKTIGPTPPTIRFIAVKIYEDGTIEMEVIDPPEFFSFPEG